MKYFDVVDEQDVVLGKKSASECHSNPDLLHRVAHFSLINSADSTVLITRRPVKNAFDGGKWCFLGEHVLSGEEYIDALYRGLRDELGISMISADAWGSSHIFAYDTQREMARFFLAYFHSGHHIHPDPNEIANMKWVTLDELQSKKATYSTITRFWVEHTSWDKAFDSVRKD